MLPVWKANPSADFGHAVDSPKLFEFVEELRGKQNIWVFPFETAQNICGTLKEQIGFLFEECLRLRRRLYPPDSKLDELGPMALKIYLERHDYWEYLTLGHSLKDAVEKHKERRMDFDLGISFGSAIHFDNTPEFLNWIVRKLDELSLIVKGLMRAITNGVEPAVGPSGKPGDIRKIIYLSNRLGQGYLSIVDWALDFLRVSAPDEFEHLLRTLKELALPLLDDIEDYASQMPTRIADGLKNAEKGGSVSLILVLKLGDTSSLDRELDRLRKASINWEN